MLAASSGCPPKTTALRGQPGDVRSLRALTKEGKAQEAFEAFEKIVEDQPDNLAAHRGLVEAAYYAGRLEQVAERYRSLAEDGRRSGLGHYGLALVAVARGPGHMQQALEQFQQAAEAMPDEPDVPYRIGLVLLMDGKPAEARAAFERALALDKDRPAFLIALGRSLADLGQGKQAIEVMRPLIGKQLSPAEARNALAVAARVFDPQRDLPVELSAEINKATDLLQQDAAQAALNVLADLAARFPRAAFVHCLQGLAHSRLGDRGEAVVAFERALALQPDNPLALVGLGDIYLRLEKWSEARGYFQQALALDPFYLDAYQRLGEMSLRLGDRDRAVRYFETLVLLQPESIPPLLDYARVLVQAGRLQEAVAAYGSVLDLDEENLGALMSLARVHLALAEREPTARQRHRDRARELLEKAQELAPDNETVQEMLADLED